MLRGAGDALLSGEVQRGSVLKFDLGAVTTQKRKGKRVSGAERRRGSRNQEESKASKDKAGKENYKIKTATRRKRKKTQRTNYSSLSTGINLRGIKKVERLKKSTKTL